MCNRQEIVCCRATGDREEYKETLSPSNPEQKTPLPKSKCMGRDFKRWEKNGRGVRGGRRRVKRSELVRQGVKMQQQLRKRKKRCLENEGGKKKECGTSLVTGF